jgi:hypothetical protein
MRFLLSALLILSGATAGGCRLAPPTPDAWLAVGFRTPRQSFATFQTALRADLPDLEYRTLAQELKAAEGINQLAYRTFREELFGENPWLRYAAEAKVIGESHLAADRVRLVAQVDKLGIRRSFTVDLVREDFYEVYEDGELLDDGFASFSRSASSPAAGELALSLPLPFGADVSRLSEARLGREWKIAGFADLPDEEPAAESEGAETPAP